MRVLPLHRCGTAGCGCFFVAAMERMHHQESNEDCEVVISDGGGMRRDDAAAAGDGIKCPGGPTASNGTANGAAAGISDAAVRHREFLRAAVPVSASPGAVMQPPSPKTWAEISEFFGFIEQQRQGHQEQQLMGGNGDAAEHAPSPASAASAAPPVCFKAEPRLTTATTTSGNIFLGGFAIAAPCCRPRGVTDVAASGVEDAGVPTQLLSAVSLPASRLRIPTILASEIHCKSADEELMKTVLLQNKGRPRNGRDSAMGAGEAPWEVLGAGTPLLCRMPVGPGRWWPAEAPWRVCHEGAGLLAQAASRRVLRATGPRAIAGLLRSDSRVTPLSRLREWEAAGELEGLSACCGSPTTNKESPSLQHQGSDGSCGDVIPGAVILLVLSSSESRAKARTCTSGRQSKLEPLPSRQGQSPSDSEERLSMMQESLSGVFVTEGEWASPDGASLVILTPQDLMQHGRNDASILQIQ